MRPLAAPSLLLFAVALPAADPPAKEPTASAIAAMVAQAGKDKPDWWEATNLAYPDTLDLTCPPGGSKGWNPKVQCGAWMWDNINPNPAKWKEGTKFWHFVLTNARQKKLTDAERSALNQLGHCYGELLQDWPRALYWYQQADTTIGRNDERTINAAYAYWRLGSRSLAVATLKPLRADATRHCSLIKLRADLGDYAEAYRLAQARVGGSEDIAWYMTGYTAQMEGNWKKALDAFTKALAADQKNSGRDWKQTRERAASAIAGITLFETLDLAKVADGTYSDSSTGYVGPVAVSVQVAGHRIAAVKVTSHHEKQYYAALEETPARIIAKQHVKGVDATLGATITSEAIVYATAKALRKGQP